MFHIVFTNKGTVYCNCLYMIVRQEVDMSDVSLSVYMSNLHCEKFNYDYSENETISDV